MYQTAPNNSTGYLIDPKRLKTLVSIKVPFP